MSSTDTRHAAASQLDQDELLDQLRESLERTQADYLALQGAHQEIQDKYTEWVDEHKSLLQLNDRLAQANAEAADLMAQLEEKNEELNELNTSLAKANAESAELMVEIEEKNEVLIHSNHQLARANAHAAELMAVIELKDEHIQELNRSLSQANVVAAELVAERELRMEELKALNNKLELEISERVRAEEIIKQMAYHDELTGLPNRRLLNDRITMAIAFAMRNRQKLAILLLDLDHFKQVNDTLGHRSGDLLLKDVGHRLSSLLRDSDTVARMGGDEFTVLLPGLVRTEFVSKIAQRILSSIREPYVVDGHELKITTSIGIAIYPEDGVEIDTLLMHADKALYQAKDQGRDMFHRYMPEMVSVLEN